MSSNSAATHFSNAKSSVSDNASAASSYPSTLNVVLEEKNKVIDRLKKQLHNQRIQLEFYIKKELNTPEILEFSKTCLPEVAEENMTVALAVNKFYKELGLKSRIMHVYERVGDAEERSNCIIQTMEYILKEIANKLKQFMTPEDIKQFLCNFDINTNYIELFNCLFNATISLQREMRKLRRTTQKLVTTEEKRNKIVEDVFTLPSEEKAICNYLVSIQMEKFELEHIIEELIKNLPKAGNNCKKLDEIGLIENNLKVVHDGLGFISRDENCESCVTKMLETIYSQAMSLLALSKDQKEKYTKEIIQLRGENERLRGIIQHIEIKSKDKRSTTSTDFGDIEKLHNVIKKTISEARKFEVAQGEELRQKSEECEKLKQKLSEVIIQNVQLQNILENNKGVVIQPAKRSSYTENRESYTLQVENLKHLRQVYSDLVQK